MSKVQTLRVFMKQRLTAAAEEIFELFERTIAEYEEELCRQRKLLDAVTEPQVQLHGADVQQLLESKEEDPPEQQERSSSLDQEDPPELIDNKDNQEELWTRQEGEQLPGLEEADITKLTVTPVPVKSGEDDEEKPQSSQLHQRQTEQMETEADGEDCGGPEPDRNVNSVSHLPPVTDEEKSHCSEPEIADKPSEPETDHSSDWEPRKPQVHSKKQVSSCSVCKKIFPSRSQVARHMRTHTGEKPFSCSVCGKKFTQRSSLAAHLRGHGEEKQYTCSVCKASFTCRSYLNVHMRSHSEEKPFSCSVCGKGFVTKVHVRAHMRTHTGEKRHSCSICGRTFVQHETLRQHLTTHT
ncbi:putative zinc finger and SCAN domain-containing protein 5C [Sparus aurata]|uniref:Zinc finger protein OZF-like n=1 Tax=Sparus aurata TaxID=8175 RepID=A0A671WZ40_SPAAU|nr:putative zinc finger and SCAN domain-containing protein 5C [Sparus aurata]